VGTFTSLRPFYLPSNFRIQRFKRYFDPVLQILSQEQVIEIIERKTSRDEDQRRGTGHGDHREEEKQG
jgi:hypothetical protein